MHKLTHDYIAAEYAKRGIRLVSKYITSSFKDKLECITCGHNWEAAYVKNGYNCPQCAIKTRNDKNRKSVDEIIAWYNERQIDVCSEYINNRLPIALSCRVCGHKWSTSFGRGCPNCCKLKLRLTTEEVKKG
jgi:DNA-directed RNA polymerase subunit RPC12/RpoP